MATGNKIEILVLNYKKCFIKSNASLYFLCVFL